MYNKNKTHDNYITRGAKNHLTYILISKGWKLRTNTINGEYKIDKKLSNGHQYRLDSYFVSPEGNHHIAEYDGQYHFTKRQMAKMVYRDEWLTKYFKTKGIDIKISHLLPDEVSGKYRLPNEEIFDRIIHSENYKISL
jgi:hypothetical protein